MINQLKELHISLGRAIETGDSLIIGIVVGQVFKELENIINEANRESVSEPLYGVHECGECLSICGGFEKGSEVGPQREERGSNTDPE